MLPQKKQIMKSVLKVLVVFIILTGLFSLPCNAQKDTVKTLKNTIRINITNPMLFGSEYRVWGYERVITKYQTASLGIGQFALPKFKSFDNDSIGITDQYHDKGFNISFDYRFYLRNENKHVAPRGVYLGPYYSFNYFSRALSWDLNTSDFTGEVNTDITLKTHLVGLQLGYQFILWKRLSIDMILMGPGWWFFNLQTDFGSTLTADDESMLLEKLNDALEEKFPGTDLVITGGDFQAKKNTKASSMGFRYLVTLGFRF
jgi:hypothetical protein